MRPWLRAAPSGLRTRSARGGTVPDIRSHRRPVVRGNPRAAVVTVAVLAVLAGLLVGVVRAPDAGADTTIPTWPPPSVPGQEAALTMDCPTSGIDLNHASNAQLQQLPGVSAPIA